MALKSIGVTLITRFIFVGVWSKNHRHGHWFVLECLPLRWDPLSDECHIVGVEDVGCYSMRGNLWSYMSHVQW